jgi:hypothetical protein
MMVLLSTVGKSTIFRNRISVVRAETDFLPDNLVCHGYFSFLPYSKKAKHLLTDDDVNYLTCTLSYDGNFSL